MNEHKKSIFFDKRDTNYIQLTSPIFFYEMFTKKKIKCDILIPQTIIFSKGSPSLWLFNSKTQVTPQIMKKNSNRLNPVEICRVMCKVRKNDEYRIDTLTTFYDLAKSMRPEKVSFARLMRQTRTMDQMDLVKMFLESNVSGLTTLQEYIQNHSKADEIYFVEYRQDVITLPVSYRFFKKSTTQKQTMPPPPVKKGNLYTSNSEDDDIQYGTYESFDCMFKFFDNAMNQNFMKLIKALVDFLEKAYKVKVKKLVAKFMLNQGQTIYFLGLKELFIDFPEKVPFEVQKVKEELRENASFENFLLLLKMFSTNPNKKPFTIPQTIYEDDKEISAKLYKKLIVQKCVGDFCEYIMEEKNRGPLQIRKNIVTDYKKYFGSKKMNEEKITVTLPHEISFQLVLRTRECSQEVVDLLKKNKIYSKTSKHHLQEYDTFNSEKEYPFQFKKTEVYNLPNLYKTVKICKNCFVVYSLTSKYFDQRLTNDLQSRQWSSYSTQNQTQQIEKPDKSERQNATTIHIEEQLSQRQNTQKSPVQSTEKLETLNSTLGNQKIERNVKSATHFRITKNTEPKTFKIYMPKPAPIQSAKTSTTSQKNINNLEINRLTMGFLNYNKPPRPHSQSSKVLQRPISSAKSNIIKRQDSVRGVNEQKSQIRTIRSAKSSGNYREQIFNSKLRNFELIHKEYNLLTVCEVQKLEYPPESIPDLQLEAVNYFSYQQCAIPYLIVENQDEISGLDLSNIESGSQVILFLGDFFDNIFEYFEMCQNLIRGNTKIILLNLPGQAYSVFNSNQNTDNIDIALLLDSFLYELHSKDFFKSVDRFKFFGLGYGAFQILNYLAYSENHLPNLDKVLLLNPFCEIDDILRDTLEKSIEVFLTCPPDMPELSFHYWNSMESSNSQEYDPRMNPISVEGRLYIIKNCLNSQNIWLSSNTEVEIQIYHGLKNCLIGIHQAELIKSRTGGNKNLNAEIKVDFLNMGHKVENLREIFNDFLI